MRETVFVSENDKMHKELVDKATEALAPDNLCIVAKGKKNKKPLIRGIEKNGITFYVAGMSEDDGNSYAVYTTNATSLDLEIAKTNTINNVRITDLFDIIDGGDGVTIEEWEPSGMVPFYIITNERKTNGAGVLLCDEVLKEIYYKVGTYFILPSSIHEILVFPETDSSKAEELSAMVKQINGDVVEEEDRLSDEAFFYDGNSWS